MKKRKVMTEHMVVVQLHCAEGINDRIRVDSEALKRFGGLGVKGEAGKVLSESDMIRNGLTRLSQISLH